MWRFTRNNAITEGFHTKMEVLQRQAYGFRNFQNYRMRVKVLCSSSSQGTPRSRFWRRAKVLCMFLEISLGSGFAPIVGVEPHCWHRAINLAPREQHTSEHGFGEPEMPRFSAPLTKGKSSEMDFRCVGVQLSMIKQQS